MSFAKMFDSFFPVIILKICIFKSPVLVGTHTLLDKSLQLPTHLSNLIQMDNSEILGCIH